MLSAAKHLGYLIEILHFVQDDRKDEVTYPKGEFSQEASHRFPVGLRPHFGQDDRKN